MVINPARADFRKYKKILTGQRRNANIGTSEGVVDCVFFAFVQEEGSSLTTPMAMASGEQERKLLSFFPLTGETQRAVAFASEVLYPRPEHKVDSTVQISIAPKIGTWSASTVWQRVREGQEEPSSSRKHLTPLST